MDSSIIAALISGAIAIIGVLVSLIIARWQTGLQKKELELKAKEIETAAKQLHSELESLRQTQFTEILKKGWMFTQMFGHVLSNTPFSGKMKTKKEIING